LWVAGQLLDEWVVEDHLPTAKLDGGSSTARILSGAALRTGDEIRTEGVPDGGDPAAIDYVGIY
jgi:hypothetical protein